MPSPKSHYIDLNDYDLGPSVKGKYKCPACGEQSLSISGRDSQIFTCWKGCARIDIRRALKPKNEAISDELAAKREAATQRRIEEERLRVAALKTTAERNADWQKILTGTTLSPKHRQDMLDRGHTEESIERSGARSLANGRYMPVRDFAGNIVNAQRADRGVEKYWYGAEGTNQLKETGKVPLSVVYPSTSPKFDKKDGGFIAYTESTGDKPWIFSTQSKCVVIGSSNIGSQPIDLKRSIDGIAAKYGWEKTYHVLMPDAGMLFNPGVMGNYAKLHQQLKELGHELHIGWWGQYEKKCGDIDEINVDTPINVISWDQFLKIRDDYQNYKPLTQLTIDARFVATTIYSNQWVKSFTPAESTITFVSSPCGTGKTEAMKQIIADWRANKPQGRVIDLTHMNAIKEGHQARLGIDDWRVGHGEDDTAINNMIAISICIDSILRLRVESITRNTLLILDEVEAVLAHLASGGTMSGKLAEFQAHFAAICERVLFGGGAIVAAEDDLTDISVTNLSNLVGNQYDLHLIKNEIQQEPWDVSIGTSKVEEFLSELLDRLRAGDRVFLPTTSQVFGEGFERLALAEIPDLAGKTVRLDRKTTADHPDLLADPVAWLSSPDRDIRLFVASPTIQSGFNIALKDFFQCVAMNASNLSTRSINQMLNRVRGNCQRLIRARKRGCDARSAVQSVEKYEKAQKLLADEIGLSHGFSRITQTLVGATWNHTAAQFSVRDNLSACHLDEYLRLTLQNKGHNVSPANWLDATIGSELRDQFKEILQQIKIDDNRTLFEANGKLYTLAQALTVSHSSTIKWLLKQQALKTILEHRARGQYLSEPALMHLYSNDKGKTWGRYEFAYLFHNPQFAKLLDLESLQNQRKQPHILYKDTPTSYQKVSLLQEIKADLLDLASGRDYDKNDPAVKRINTWCLKNSSQAFKYFEINFKPESIDSHGCVRNTAIANVNKVLKLLGYNGKSTRQVGSKKDRIYIYQVENPDSGERLLVSNAMAIREQETRDSMSKKEVEEAESLAELADLKRDELAEGLAFLADYQDLETLAHLRTLNDPELVRSATKSLPPEKRKAICEMVLELNARKSA